VTSTGMREYSFEVSCTTLPIRNQNIALGRTHFITMKLGNHPHSLSSISIGPIEKQKAQIRSLHASSVSPHFIVTFLLEERPRFLASSLRNDAINLTQQSPGVMFIDKV
jgi:hypothetical protein